MFARVRVQGTDPYQAIMIPDESVGTDQTNKFALTVAEDGTVVRKNIALGPIIDGLRVIRSGLTADDVVILRGLQRARAGTKVATKEEQFTGPLAPLPMLSAPVQPPLPGTTTTPTAKSATAPPSTGAPLTAKQ